MAVFRIRGAWRAEVYIKSRRVASQSGFATKKAAQAWHDKVVVARRDNPNPESAATFEELVERFKAWHLPSVGERTRELYLLELRLRIEPFFRFMRLERIDVPMLEAFKAKVAGEVGPKSANHCLGVLSLLLGKAVKWRMLRESPYCLDPVPVPVQTYHWWTDRDHIAAFLAAAKRGRYYGVYLAALETGMRIGELLGLSKGDVDFDHGLIHVHRQWTPKHCFGVPKHNKERWVSFDAKGELAAALRKHIETSQHPEAVFATRAGRRLGRTAITRKYFWAAIERAGVPLIKFHDLRHTYASWFMREVGDIWALKELLGHSDIKTTQRYAHHAKRRKLPTLSLTQFTHNSLTDSESEILTGRNERGKPWWGYTDLKRNKASLAA